MASQVEICNRALTKLGSKRITDIAENSGSARIMTALWDTVRKAEIRKRLWAFALARTALPALSAAPAWGFSYAYQLPPDYLRIVQVNDLFIDPNMVDYRDNDDSAYAIEQGQILTDFSAPLKIRYLKDVTDPGAFDPTFVEAFASKLAYEAEEERTNSNQKRQLAAQDYKDALREAYKTNAIERPPQGFPDDSWILIRL